MSEKVIPQINLEFYSEQKEKKPSETKLEETSQFNSTLEKPIPDPKNQKIAAKKKKLAELKIDGLDDLMDYSNPKLIPM